MQGAFTPGAGIGLHYLWSRERSVGELSRRQSPTAPARSVFEPLSRSFILCRRFVENFWRCIGRE